MARLERRQKERETPLIDIAAAEARQEVPLERDVVDRQLLQAVGLLLDGPLTFTP